MQKQDLHHTNDTQENDANNIFAHQSRILSRQPFGPVFAALRLYQTEF